MRGVTLVLAVCLAMFAEAGLWAQEADSVMPANNPPAASQPVPRLIMLSGTLKDLTGKPLTGPVDLDFAIYKEQTDAAPLWQESQTLNVDEQGHYTVLLGAMQPQGLPVDLFTSGEARWLGVSAGKLSEQPRVLLVSVPYALKANDAEMLGGKPASAYMLAPPAESAASQGPGTSGATGPRGAATTDMSTPGKPTSGPKPNVAGTGTQNYIPVWTNSSGTLGNSVMYQSAGLVGVGTASPSVALDVYGANAGLRLSGTGVHQVQMSGSATSGRLGQDAVGFFLTSDTNGAALRFATNNGTGHEWMRITSAGNVGIGTTTPGYRLDVVGGSARVTNPSGTTQLVVTGSATSGRFGQDAGGLFLSSDTNGGALRFATNNGSGHEWMRITSAGNVGIGTSAPKAKLDVAGNINIPATFDATAGVITMAGAPFIHVCCNATSNVNTYVGYNAGNLTTTAPYNTGLGGFALQGDTSGGGNTGVGYAALTVNSTGQRNTAVGNGALYRNTTGNYNASFGDDTLNWSDTSDANTAFGECALLNTSSTGASTTLCPTPNSGAGSSNTGIGWGAGNYNTTGNQNTFLGFNTGPGSRNLVNATAIGANAVVGASNSLVLGSISGQNGATSSAYVGIGTTTPGDYLEVNIGNPGPANSGITIDGTSSTYGDLGLKIYNTGAGGVDWFIDSTNNGSGYGGGYLAIVPGPGDVPVMYIHAGPAVGIGTGETSHPFTVCYQCGNAYADGWSTYSSRRFKTNIHTLSHALATVQRLRGVSYNNKSDGTSQVGVIAEEVEPVLPQVVGIDKDGKAEGVDYSRLTAVLIEAAKEQQREIQRQQAIIQKQQAQIARLISQVSVIQASLKAKSQTASTARTVNPQPRSAKRAAPAKPAPRSMTLARVQF